MTLDSNLYQHSGRLALAFNAQSRNPGFSCNYHRVGDSLKQISFANDWTLKIATNNGAPSLDFSSVRPKGSPISSGGVSPGTIPFMHTIDAVLSSAKRNHNKNHAGLIGLDADHPDLQDFLDAKFAIASKVVYFPEGYKLTEEKARLFHSYYIKQPKLFFHKRQGNRGTNLCTEILMPQNGTCVLGTFNLAYYTSYEHLVESFADDFTAAAMELVKADLLVKMKNASNGEWAEYISYAEDNLQVGLSITGMATLLGRLGIRYHQFFNHPIADVFARAYYTAKRRVTSLYPYTRLFCQAPLVHSHRKFTDVNGLSVTPGLEPLEGTLVGDYKLCRIISSDHPTIEQKHAPSTWTVEDVTIDEWMDFNNEYRRMFIDQSISFSVFDGDELFSVNHFTKWFNSSLPSLYYYVPFIPTEKSQEVKFSPVPVSVSLGKWQHLADACGCAG